MADWLVLTLQLGGGSGTTGVLLSSLRDWRRRVWQPTAPNLSQELDRSRFMFSLLLRLTVFVVGFILLRHLLLRSFYLFRFIALRPILPKQQVFLFALFSMMAQLAKVDGRIVAEEINAVQAFMREGLGLNPEMQRRAINLFREAKLGSESFNDYGRLLYERFSTQPAILFLTLDILFGVATADRSFSAEEDRLLRGLANLFGLSDLRYEALRYSYLKESGILASEERARQESRQRTRTAQPQFVSSLDHYYAILNCHPSASAEELKASYRKLALEHHPDRMIARGYPQQLIQAANRRLQEINVAYEAIQKARAVR